MTRTATAYALKIHSERFFKTMRYHWTVCGANDPDELISWGYASSQLEAEEAAQREIKDLCAGLTQGGRVAAKKVLTRRPLF